MNSFSYPAKTDIFQKEGGIELSIDMPGVHEDDLEILLSNHILSISGSVKVSLHTSIWSEYPIGDYQRNFHVNNDLQKEEITASFENGVLRLWIPGSGSVFPVDQPLQ